MWRLIPGQSLQYRAWDDEFVLYNNLSGDTHLLGASAMHILLTLQRAASDEEAMTESLGASLQRNPDNGLPSLQVSGLLADLAALALIEHNEC